ncbi:MULTISPECIES: hypothetical protein [unclassified Methylophaga]|jgi:hypothetical protein|uniref:hypothetical protein n=2 Tax=Methylophaga TaxID=40222 RepID=UPI000C62E9AD|nr:MULTISPECIES: hypothetical protein [unclassified Methylophaga]MAL49269.1 hypothetical protein [Methylophaga sp.]MBP25924.1 hypothetical protein [Methylophaga sp.]HCC79880.1 hypothetical protein [Methylophaga sp.]|tara:strand:- start:6876 stop:7523 length:648 start_codon:yes stop_codon:yes gene_type:complete
MDNLDQLFASVAVIAEFHPKLKAIRFWQDSNTLEFHSSVIFYDRTLEPREELEADIANIATQLALAALPDYHAFCVDLEHLFDGAQPSGPIAQLTDVDWRTFRKISSYAQYWKQRSPREVNKLITFVMAVPVFSRLAGQLIVQSQNATENQIFEQIAQQQGSFIMGGKRFRELFRQEIDTAYNEAKLLVSTFRGTKTDEAPRIVNGMLESMVTKS